MTEKRTPGEEKRDKENRKVIKRERGCKESKGVANGRIGKTGRKEKFLATKIRIIKSKICGHTIYCPKKINCEKKKLKRINKKSKEDPLFAWPPLHPLQFKLD